MRRLLIIFTLLAVVSALSVEPQEAYNAKIGVPLSFSITVDKQSKITVETGSSELFSWTEKTVYTGKTAVLEFTPDVAGEHKFTVSDGSDSVEVIVTAVEVKDYGYIEKEYVDLSIRADELESERKRYRDVDTADIARDISDAKLHLTDASFAYNSSKYTTAEIEINAASEKLDVASLALSEAAKRPKESGISIDIAVLMVVLLVVVAVAAKYFLM